MENKTIARTLRLLSQLMELHEVNPFKIKSIANAYFKVDKLPFALKDKPLDEIDKIDGIGKSLAGKIIELLQTGELKELNDIIGETPEGVVEMLSIKGIGPKKILIIWRTLGIESMGELYYACNENRLIEAKGFGLKTQEEIKNAIEFKLAANGRFLYAQVEGFANTVYAQISEWLIKVDNHSSLAFAGQFRRACEIIDELEFVIGAEQVEEVQTRLETFEPLSLIAGEDCFITTTEAGLRIKVFVVDKSDFYLEWFKLTGNTEHVEQVLKLTGDGPFKSEEAIYNKAGLAFIEPELREGLDEIALAKENNLPKLITDEDSKGSLHNHSTWSDGVHTLEQMAVYCKDTLNLKYLGICDHSKTAVYAKGLNEQRVFAQHLEIDELNKKLSPFKIFKGIESDILSDGSLDYSDEVLKTFDFVVASVHSNLRMDESKATARLLKAIENPYTTILGHPTGRLLLSRAGYSIDYKKVIDACAANKVVIEINANPLRLDLDWRWHRYALEKGVLLSVNPDAHRTEGFHDMRYGILVARKGGLSADKCLNAFSLEEITEYFNAKRG
ncbi:helix-hairpin-helix domain-containing protein [Pedobacter sp. MC2016-05]|uniref:helix-hairpin-helix domain-containing protein n=1 Tax=Pedobacter sp. MC2016-05 TaxID=2994474 RepID=UPI0022483F0A|nr:helix-hairpin-helix domain-containing protein [Pedobacter sp. MC2016-05]MCX2473346.1 helix-hairpin-helix domain-containing protein [Pedobacter sp. MC2016-05]